MIKLPQYFSIFALSALVILGFSFKPNKPQLAAISASNTVSVSEKPNDESRLETKVNPSPVPPVPIATPKPSTKKIVPKLIPKPTPISATPPPLPVSTDCEAGDFNSQFLCLINNHRLSKNLNTLSYDHALTAVAAIHSAWMNTNATMSHIGENGSAFYERCRSGLTTCDAENIAKGYTTAQKLFDAWKNSSGHNANMLGTHTKIGLSLVGSYSTLLFR